MLRRFVRILLVTAGGLSILGGCGGGRDVDLAETPDFGTTKGEVSLSEYSDALCKIAPRLRSVFRSASASMQSAANVRDMEGSTPAAVFEQYDLAVTSIAQNTAYIRKVLSEAGYPRSDAGDGEAVAKRVRELLGFQPLVDELAVAIRAVPREEKSTIEKRGRTLMDDFRKEILIRTNRFSTLGERDEYFDSAVSACGYGSVSDIPRL